VLCTAAAAAACDAAPRAFVNLPIAYSVTLLEAVVVVRRLHVLHDDAFHQNFFLKKLIALLKVRESHTAHAFLVYLVYITQRSPIQVLTGPDVRGLPARRVIRPYCNAVLYGAPVYKWFGVLKIVNIGYFTTI